MATVWVPKDKSHSNRGMAFEETVKYANKLYRLDGVAVIEKQHTECKPIVYGGQIRDAKYYEKATVDFIGRYGDIPVAFECKASRTARIEYTAVKDHQADFLTDWQTGGVSFVLCCFSSGFNESIYAIPWDYWRAARTEWTEKKRDAGHVMIDMCGVTVQTNGMASVSAGELPREWAVAYGGVYGLDYLRIGTKSAS